jgi:cytochrome P450
VSAREPEGIIVQYDPRDPVVIADPLPALKRLQDEDPVHWSDVLGGWVITRYDDVRRVQLGTQVSADRLTPFYESLPSQQQERIRKVIRYLNTWVAFKDPPDHGRMRSILNAVISTREINAMAPRIEREVDALLDRLEEHDECDFIQAFAFPLPATVIMLLCDLPLSDMEQIKSWSDLLKPFIGSATSSPDKYDQAREGAVMMSGYFRQVVRERAKRPGTDVLSKLTMHMGTEGGLSEDEVVGACMLFLFGGHETTTNLIGNGMRCLMRFEDARERLLADPTLIQSAVEEVLRFDGPTGGLVRVVRRTHDFHGRTLQQGDRVFSMIHAANHDPRRFDDPERFDITRNPNPHVTFNHGPHFCLGAPLARLEGRIALERVLRRFPKMSLIGPVTYMDTLVMRGVRQMNVRLRA